MKKARCGETGSPAGKSAGRRRSKSPPEKVFMKITIFLLAAALLLAGSDAFSQTRRPSSRQKSKVPPARTGKTIKPATPAVPVYRDDDPPPPPPSSLRVPVGKKAEISDVFENAAIGKWGVANLSVPSNLEAEPETERTQQNKEVSWKVYTRRWKLPATGSASTDYEVELSVTTWDRDFTFIKELKPELATPENMLLMDLVAEEKNKNTPGSFVKEARQLEAGGVRGGFFRAEFPEIGRRFLSGWYTYRLFGGKGQRISLTVTSRESEPDKTMRIISSLRLQ